MNKPSFCIFLIGILLAGLFSVDLGYFVVEASSEEAGLTQVINSEVLWENVDSPYELTGPLFVSEGATLTIEAGISLYLNGYDVRVNGALRVLGNSSDKIFVIGNSNTIEFTDVSIGWDEETSLGNIIENTVLDGVNIVSSVSIKICNSSIDRVDVSNSSIIEGNTINTLQIDGGSVVVKNCTIDLVRSCYGAAEISHNIIDEFCPNGYGFSPIISNNKIRTIGGYTIEGQTFTTMHATLYSTVIINNIITEGIYLVSGPSTVIQNNTITGVPHKYTYYVFVTPFPGSPGDPREGTYYTTGIDLAGRGADIKDKIYIRGNTISGCSTGIKGGNPSFPIKGEGVLIENNFISNCIDIGIDVSSQAIIKNNSISNTSTAIAIKRSFPVSINYNNIENYTDHGILLLDASEGVDATNNWWGTTDIHTINMSIHDFKFDFNLGKVTLGHILDSPNHEIKLIPEFPLWIILPLFLGSAFVIVVFKKKNELEMIK